MYSFRSSFCSVTTDLYASFNFDFDYLFINDLKSWNISTKIKLKTFSIFLNRIIRFNQHNTHSFQFKKVSWFLFPEPIQENLSYFPFKSGARFRRKTPETSCIFYCQDRCWRNPSKLPLNFFATLVKSKICEYFGKFPSRSITFNNLR